MVTAGLRVACRALALVRLIHGSTRSRDKAPIAARADIHDSDHTPAPAVARLTCSAASQPHSSLTAVARANHVLAHCAKPRRDQQTPTAGGEHESRTPHHGQSGHSERYARLPGAIADESK
ncbi:MAG: hypothetical protein QOI01_5429 [Mycobacterium sp.]|jgi:hypothetical protein|nr:hypothetical protein [Mycobacterium sp.]